MRLMRPDSPADQGSGYLLVDGDNLLRTTWEATPGDCVSTFEKRLRAIRNRWAGYSRLLVWDGPNADDYRVALFPSYKSHRPETPESYKFLRGNAPKLASRGGWQSWTCDYAEADDVIGSLCRSAVKSKSRVVIISGDRDLHQLLTCDLVRQVRSFKSLGGDLVEIRQVTASDLQQEYGLKAMQWALYRAMTGDVTDGIPGVPDVGPKTAQALFREFPGLTAANISEAIRTRSFVGVTKDRHENLRKAIEDGTLATFVQLTTLRRIPRGDMRRLG